MVYGSLYFRIEELLEEKGISYSHIDLISDILIRHRVVHLVYCDVIIKLNGSGFPIAEFKAGSRQRCQ